MLKIPSEILQTVLGYLQADWYLLAIGILLAVIINVYVDSDKLRKFLERKAGLSVPAAVVFGAFTPLCACGTTAVLLSMFISAMPWAPVMAFLISSPLTSPSEFMFEAAFLGNNFAVAMIMSSVVMGVGAGVISHFLSKRTRFFEGQFRLVNRNTVTNAVSPTATSGGTSNTSSACSCDNKNEVVESCCGGCTVIEEEQPFIKKYKLDEFIKGLYSIGVKKVLFYFVIFIAVGKIFEIIIPKEWIMTLFSSDKAYSIPLSATLGLPLYLTDASALPLLRSFLNAGAGQGAILAFLITGKATGIPVMAGLATILKKRAILFYIACIYFGGIIAGFIYQFICNLI